MPIYEYRCHAYGQQFEKLVRTFDAGEVSCLFCHSLDVERLLSSPLIRMGKSFESTSEFTAKDAEVNHYKGKKDYDRGLRLRRRRERKREGMKPRMTKAGNLFWKSRQRPFCHQMTEDGIDL